MLHEEFIIYSNKFIPTGEAHSLVTDEEEK